MASELNTEGFVKDLSTDVVKVNLDRRRYKAEICSPFGGWRGYVIKREMHRSDMSKNAENPDGEFWDIIVRLDAPAPCVDEKDNVVRVEKGEDILVVANKGLEALLALADDTKYCALVECFPIEKIKHKKGEYWRFKLGIKNERIDKGTVVPELGLLNSFQDVFDKALTDGSAT